MVPKNIDCILKIRCWLLKCCNFYSQCLLIIIHNRVFFSPCPQNHIIVMATSHIKSEQVNIHELLIFTIIIWYMWQYCIIYTVYYYSTWPYRYSLLYANIGSFNLLVLSNNLLLMKKKKFAIVVCDLCQHCQFPPKVWKQNKFLTTQTSFCSHLYIYHHREFSTTLTGTGISIIKSCGC